MAVNPLHLSTINNVVAQNGYMEAGGTQHCHAVCNIAQVFGLGARKVKRTRGDVRVGAVAQCDKEREEQSATPQQLR